MITHTAIKSSLTGIILGLFVLMAASGVYAQNINIEDVPEFKPGEPHPVEAYMEQLREMRRIYSAPEEVSPDGRQQLSTDAVDRQAVREVVFAENEAADPDSLIAHAYLQFWTATQKSNPGMALSVAAWQNTSSWGNFGMQDMGTVPRVPLPTDRDYRYISVMIQPWISGYAAINMAEEVLIAIEDGETITDSNGEDVTDRAKAFAHFVQGITYGFLAQLYEGGFIYEAGDRNFEDVNFVGYEGLKDEAITRLEEARNLATFSGEIPFEWMPVIESSLEDYGGGEIAMNSDRFERVVNSYEARTRVLTARDAAERDAIDWNRVGELAADGIEEHLVLEADSEEGWWGRLSGSIGALSQNPVWTRAAYPTIGKYDESGNYQNWLNEDWADRTEMTIETPDARVMAQTDGTPDPVSRGLYFAHAGPSFFDPGRGTYFFSEYHHMRWEESYQGSVSDMHHMLTAEMDLYRAEAELRNDNSATAADLINQTRNEIGELEPADAEDGFDELMEMINYERRIELMNTAAGIGFFDMRSQDLLTEGTQKQFPVDPMVAPPAMVSPEINSFDNPGDLTLEVGYFEEAFAYHLTPDEISIQVANDAWIEDVVFEEANTTQHSFDLDLDEGEVYYVHLTSHENKTGQDYTGEEIYAFATVGHEPTDIATIRNEIVEDEELRVAATVKGTAISPVTEVGLFLDDGTGGISVRDVPVGYQDDIEQGDVVKTFGDLEEIRSLPSFYFYMADPNLELTGAKAELPEYQQVPAEAIRDDLHDSSDRRVSVSNVVITDPDRWPDEPYDEDFTSSASFIDPDTEFPFSMEILFASELDGTRPPLGEVTVKGINSSRGELYPLERPEIIQFDELGPDDGMMVGTTTPEVSWSDVEGIDRYHVVVYADEAGTDTLQYHADIQNTSLELDELTMGQTYYWQVHPVGWEHPITDEAMEDVVGMGSPLRSFSTETLQLVSPAEGEEDIAIPTSLEWNEIDQADSYEIELSHTSAFDTSLVVRDYENTEIEIEEVVTDTTEFFWRVRAEVDGKKTNWSEVWNFTTELRPPEVPEWKPEDGAEDVEELIVEWSAAERAETYNLQLAEDEEFDELVVDEEGIEETEYEIDELEGNTTYYWRIEAHNASGGSGWSDVLSFTTADVVSAGEEADIPEEFALGENYPNPFNPETQISYALPEQAQVRLEVYNVLGEHVTTLVNEQQSAGRYEVSFDASNLSSGTYIYRIEVGEFTETRQMMFVK